MKHWTTINNNFLQKSIFCQKSTSMALQPKDTPAQTWTVGLLVTLYITAMTDFLGMLSAPKNENA